jgi:hypothetical protein
VGANTYRSRTAINKQEGIGEAKEDTWINDCIVWCVRNGYVKKNQ